MLLVEEQGVGAKIAGQINTELTEIKREHRWGGWLRCCRWYIGAEGGDGWILRIQKNTERTEIIGDHREKGCSDTVGEVRG